MVPTNRQLEIEEIDDGGRYKKLLDQAKFMPTFAEKKTSFNFITRIDKQGSDFKMGKTK